MRTYKILQQQVFTDQNYSLVPIRNEDRYDIMKWRNEQLFHLRQSEPLTKEKQDAYFTNVVSKLFDQHQPNQILFSFLENDICIGYGGLVHINWIDKNAEISFVINTTLEKDNFKEFWQNYLSLIEEVAFTELNFHKIFTFAFDLRPHLYTALEGGGYNKEAQLKEHCYFNCEYKDVIIHSKFNAQRFYLRPVQSEDSKLLFEWANDKMVRQNAFNSESLVWENHLKWFNDKLKDDSAKIFVLCKGTTPLGQIRIDLINHFWEIDYSIDKEYRGQGLGKKIIQLLSSKHSSEFPLKAYVKHDNIASLKVFRQTGFEEIREENNSVFIKK